MYRQKGPEGQKTSPPETRTSRLTLWKGTPGTEWKCSRRGFVLELVYTVTILRENLGETTGSQKKRGTVNPDRDLVDESYMHTHTQVGPPPD